jgi:hypothetical protein
MPIPFNIDQGNPGDLGFTELSKHALRSKDAYCLRHASAGISGGLIDNCLVRESQISADFRHVIIFVWNFRLLFRRNCR